MCRSGGLCDTNNTPIKAGAVTERQFVLFEYYSTRVIRKRVEEMIYFVYFTMEKSEIEMLVFTYY